ncbi:MarR family winged helix-turn-helix transcriptional regulator [Mucilaginibacter galii]|uniref:MarR family winged helix-turn-helix transcriptional regulator n=1 Tax=Mucilaginibacter galii TaxID=2005073 RepID=UPI0016659605|nr:MarR family transcriptional regulator [Mucilaginibacter galii]
MEKCDINKDLLLFKIFHIHKIICNKANKYFSKEGVVIQVEQIPVLMTVFYHGPQTQQDIAHELFRDKSSVLRTVASLVASDYLTVTPDGTDKRKKMVAITPKGTEAAQFIAKEVVTTDSKMFANLSVAEKLILTELLDKCANHINNAEYIDGLIS